MLVVAVAVDVAVYVDVGASLVDVAVAVIDCY